MGRITIAAYRPKEGRAEDLRALVAEHHRTLLAEGLVTERRPTVMRGQDGTLLELFEWASPAAIEAAHRNETVQKLWERFASVSEFLSLGALPESAAPFPDFEPLD